MNLPTQSEIGSALAHLEHYRVLHVQELLYPYQPISASIMLALGFRESGLKNICGGAQKVNGVWVQSFGDRGYLQISDQFDAPFLEAAEGCANGTWYPASPRVSAFEPMHVPRFSPATLYVKREMESAYEVAVTKGVHSGDRVRFAVAAHNAGVQGALDGWRAGNMDANTAGGDYSAYVLAVAPMIHDWIVGHPNWVYHPS